MSSPFVFGGTFNPVHRGHLFLMHRILGIYRDSRILIVPSFIPPFKEKEHTGNFDVRYHLLELSLDDYAELYSKEERCRLILSDVERKFNRKVYTSELIAFLQEEYGRAEKMKFVAGDDILKSLALWHDADFLKKNVRFIIYSRSTTGSGKDLQARQAEGFEIEYIDSDVNLSSSTAVRRDVKNAEEMLTPRVLEEYKKLWI